MSRVKSIKRTTKETDIALTLDIDGHLAQESIVTGLPLFDHFLGALAQHSGYGLELKAEGDLLVDPHHLVEDVGICLGDALSAALGDRSGIQRFGQRYLPMDEALVLVALDISGRGQLFWSGPFPDRAINNVSSEVWPEFFKALAQHAQMTLHVVCHTGENAHHVMEACFKGLGRSLKEATMLTNHLAVPSTKGMI